LPHRQVQAISISGDKTNVGTPFGVTEFGRGRFSRVLGAGLLVTSLHIAKEQLLVGTEDQGVVQVPLAARRAGVASHGSADLAEVRQFLGTKTAPTF
jgi:hypothetical protein